MSDSNLTTGGATPGARNGDGSPWGRPWRYFDGERHLFADPLSVWRRLHLATRGQLRALISAARSEDAEVAGPAAEALLAAVREAFQMRPLDPATGEGATEHDCRRLLTDFLSYLRAGGAEEPAEEMR